MMLPSLYPLVSSIQHPSAHGLGPLDCGGATIHYSADRDLDRVVKDGLSGTTIGYHLIIDRDGRVTQTTYLDQRVDHAGIARWRGLSPNRRHLGICLISWGMLQVDDTGALISWNGIEVPTCDAREDGSFLQPRKLMWWDAATAPQMETTLQVLRWAIALGAFTADDVAGHDQVAMPPGRKVDPGGVWPGGAAAIRQALKAS